jgi:hypothetical protein
MLEEVYGYVAMKKTQVYRWHKHFCDSHTSVSEDLCCGQPSIKVSSTMKLFQKGIL